MFSRLRLLVASWSSTQDLYQLCLTPRFFDPSVFLSRGDILRLVFTFTTPLGLFSLNPRSYHFSKFDSLRGLIWTVSGTLFPSRSLLGLFEHKAKCDCYRLPQGANDVSYNTVDGISDFHTPNIDRLAQSGIILSNYYTNAVCTPTRAALMTGASPHVYIPSCNLNFHQQRHADDSWTHRQCQLAATA